MLKNNIIKIKLENNKNVNIIDNTQNTNFELLVKSLIQLSEVVVDNKNRKILIIGNIENLGDSKDAKYKILIDAFIKANIDLVCAVGDEIHNLYQILPEKIKSLHTKDVVSLQERIKFILLDGDTLIISGLKNIKVDTIVEHFDDLKINLNDLNKVKDTLDVFAAKSVLFDNVIESFLDKNNISGASVAISLNDKITYSQGYGFSNKEKTISVDAKINQFRLLNISQDITAMAILILVDQKKIDLEEKVFGLGGILSKFKPLENEAFNNDLNDIKLIHLLQHTAGWDNKNTKNPFNGKTSFDPMFSLHRINKNTKEKFYATKEGAIRYMLSQPIQNKPGEKFVYSNFGYVVLGRIIEVISGKSYFEFIDKNISKPLKLTSVQLAKTKLEDCKKNEVYYFPRRENNLVPSVSNLKEKVVESYGSFAIEEIDSSLGLIATVEDILNFALNFEKLLTKETFLLISQKPNLKVKNKHNWYGGLGWRITKLNDNNYNLWSTGTIDIGGCTCFIARSANKNKISWAMLCNKSVATSSIKDIISKAKNYFE
jgi:CubicO group peptidase (beta-lactamase class C family)